MKQMNRHDMTAPDAADFEAIVSKTMAHLPGEFRSEAVKVALRIVDFAPDHMMRDLQIEDPFELTGLYDGIPLTEKSVMDQPTAPDTIWLFRRPILDEWVARGDVLLSDLVSHVYVHELAHHFGWSDDDIASIDRWWE